MSLVNSSAVWQRGQLKREASGVIFSLETEPTYWNMLSVARAVMLVLSYWSNQNSRHVGQASTCTGRAVTNTSTVFSVIVVLQLGQRVIGAF